ncbi:hypothetical protein AAHA92_32771 [Salvia divinorum]|uniref:C2 domain-containing protein n=1 Tax=Salvia divinorum TaxID=28513 RepID=A0ABD1FLT5_SALDI
MPRSKLLEINLISAHDLPPVSNTLRTFAVAYVSPDNKLTTKTDHRGHTNPSWHYKMLFHVHKNFLKHDSAALTIEIYNLAWLRDLPIGIARLHLNTLSPPLTENSGYRRLSLQISQPSGHLKGTVSVGIQLIDMDDDISLSSLRITDQESVANENAKGQKVSISHENPKSLEEKRPGPDESVRSTPETRTVTSGGSGFSGMRPGLKKRIYDADTVEYGSSIFENWTEGGDKSEVRGGIPENEEWAVEGKEMVPMTSEMAIEQRWNRKNGLFKCFSNMHGFEFTFACGANQFRLNKKKKGNLDRLHNRSQSDGSLGRFYS